jgi:anti-sigma28 factor (negative regulator of flagellin synthesis)
MQVPNPAFQEKRQFGRVEISQPITYEVYVLQYPDLWRNQGQIRNISLGGLYFDCEGKPPLGKNDTGLLAFDALYNDLKIYRLMIHGLVVRTDYDGYGGSQFPLALQFCSDPVYCPLVEKNYVKLSSFDETRILCQNYNLYKKAHEVIKQTPDIRTHKINNLKQLIDLDAYKIDQKKLAQRFIDSLISDIRSLARK